MYAYCAFGMDIRSVFPLTVLERPEGYASEWMVEISEESVALIPDLPWKIGRISYGSGLQWIQVEVPWAARYRIEDDSRILVEPVPGVAPGQVTVYLEGLVLPIMLRHHPLLVFHGSAVRNEGGAIVFLGTQGSGKSTAAAVATGFGYRVLCDDIVPISASAMVLPGIPRLKLLPDAYGQIMGVPDPRAFDGVDKYRADLGVELSPSKIGAVVILESSGIGALHLELLLGREKIKGLLPHLCSIEGIDDPKGQFSRLTGYLGKTPVFKAVRPVEGWSAQTNVEQILAFIEGGQKSWCD